MKQKSVEILIPRLSPLMWILHTTLNGRGNQILELKKKKTVSKITNSATNIYARNRWKLFRCFVCCTGDSTFCQPSVQRPSTDNKRSMTYRQGSTRAKDSFPECKADHRLEIYMRPMIGRVYMTLRVRAYLASLVWKSLFSHFSVHLFRISWWAQNDPYDLVPKALNNAFADFSVGYLAPWSNRKILGDGQDIRDTNFKHIFRGRREFKSR